MSTEVKKRNEITDEGRAASECGELLETRLHIPTISTGTMRTSATWIAVMLMAEDNPAEILAGVMQKLGITPEQVHDEYHDRACTHCGVSLLAHRQNGGECF